MTKLLRERAKEAREKQDNNTKETHVRQIKEVLEEKFGITTGVAEGEYVVVEGLKFRYGGRYFAGGYSRDVSVWHNDAWHDVYGLESLDRVISIEAGQPQEPTTTEVLIECLEQIIYEIVEEALHNT